jgi:hypothetical protein
MKSFLKHSYISEAGFCVLKQNLMQFSLPEGLQFTGQQ